MKFVRKIGITGRVYGALIGLIMSGLCITICYLFPMWWCLYWLPILYFPIGFWIGYTYDRINALANFDCLTGVANRGLLMKTLYRCLNKAANSGTPLSIIFIDIDNFKQINDIHGHDQGDLALKIVAREIKANLRSTDIVGRFGGDEFVIICPGASRIQSEAIARRVKKSIECKAFGTFGNIKLTISTGISVYPEDGSTIDKLLSFADKVMYRNKEKRCLAGGVSVKLQ
ncbi:MAG: GGDEF domain-containing protein [Moorella sp. (in: firmicutes)]